MKVDAFNSSIEALLFPGVRATIRFTPFEHDVNAGMGRHPHTQNRDTLTNRLISGCDFSVRRSRDQAPSSRSRA